MMYTQVLRHLTKKIYYCYKPFNYIQLVFRSFGQLFNIPLVKHMLVIYSMCNTAFGYKYDRVFSDVFKKGVLYKGIFCPSLSNSFHSKQLETSYLHYSNRQRQKSLIMLNIVDLSLKVNLKDPLKA